MTQTGRQRGWMVLGFALAVALLSGGIWSYGYRQALDSLAERSRADLALASDRVSTQLQVYQELAVLMTEHPVLTQLDTDAQRDAAALLMQKIADKTGAMDLFYADLQGRVLAAAVGVAGLDVTGEAYFTRAMQGALGTGYEIPEVAENRAYFYAAPAFSADGSVRGTVVAVVDVNQVEQTWRGSLPPVFFTDERGEVFISNRSELLFWTRAGPGQGLLTPEGQAPEFRATHKGPHEIWHLGWGPYLPQQALHLTVDLPVIDMTGEILVDVSPARRIAGLQAATIAALCLAFGAMLFLATERRRALAGANAVLETRVEERTRALTATNVHLRREVKERLEAEAALKKAQADLVQAGKLSALGQMSAGISHELNQPLMAIQQFADNGLAFMARDKPEKAGENLGRIAEMATRMARIIKNLRAFARNESEPMSRVDLCQVISDAVELTAARLKADGVTLDWDAAANPLTVYAKGGEVRLGQVFVNLINNAADAMLEQENRHITVTLNAAERLAVTVRDIGPGLKEPEKVFEPFYSTKAVGSAEGMGLGLSISYGLVQSFGGKIRGRNTGEGAEFTVELDYWNEEKAA